MTVHCASLKNYYEGTLISNFAYRMFIPNIESKVVLSFIRNANCLSKRSEFATNSPISVIFNFWSCDLSCDN